ncbi:DUF1553 domain-containing protein [Dyadobacter sp. CY107]|uniref:DUF1553 domain-containing protein n=1 Tax=Dyadobacter fanqingshengii TaxID=2906443 RepID=UPI001F44C2C2|nr:DUF1553 domain-containing protein [Dyadobacter fanqingshengii]MCF2504779.1 DUF1553 domain-containing protein [Dyadobacter fanqingshengii]
MLSNRLFIGAGVLIIAISSFFWLSGSLGSSSVDYNTEVKPILNKNCMGCHGGVKKAGDVSFLFEHEMVEPGKSGKIPVVRGDADASEMIRRILSDDPDEKMPKNGTPLKEEEIAILKKWINQGAKWETHWSYKKIEKPDVPSLNGFSNFFGLFDNADKKWATNEIDHFILDKLKDKGLNVSAEADRATLIRRVSLDLTGLPPTEKQVADFANDKSENAYEKVVDRLLKSPAYGERWTSMWMDLARYADTKGYESDGGRTMWRYRDYVVKSFNQDKPFDQFTIEQLAGDLLQKDKDGFPLEENMIATGYHRNTMTNNEGGTDDEEFRTAAQIDRVNTTWEVWQGTTFACIQCHSHPYDPIPHEDYYKYMAFFNNTRDEDVWDEWPKMRFYKGDDSARVERVKSWIRQNKPEQLPQVTQFMKVMEPKINAHNFVKGDQSTVLLISYYGVKNNGNARISQVDLSEADNVVMNVSTKAQNAVLSLHLDKLDGPVISQMNVPVRDSVIIAPVTKTPGKHDIFLSLKSSENPEEWVRITWMAFQKALPGSDKPEYKNIVADYATVLTRQTESMPVIWEGKGDFARKTNVFVRGNWMVKGAEVKPDVPKLLAPMPKDAPKDRVGLAKWIVSRDNALTSRVIVNRFWEQLFGKGIVETLEDFGSQGAEPTHPELLDWLAVKFMEEDKWSIKKMLKTIVISSTYRQSSKTDENKLEKDPYNVWISRGPRVRLSAEQVRDQALACSGLISDKMYGPGVMPPQPDKIWQSPYSGEKWVLSEGEDRYRRGVYTYWKRTAPYPSMVTFDAPSREFCQSRRILTNTPLQALVTLNDPVYLEAAEKLATKMQQRGKTPEQQLKEGYRMLTFQSIEQKNLNVLVKVYKQALDAYKKKPVEADSMLVYGKERTPELAALTISANVMLNLDNVITKE